MKPVACILLALFAGPAAFAAIPMQAPSADKVEAVSGSNAFAADLFRQLLAQPGNMFFSPESICTAFAMAYAGARGQTAAEMAKVLHFTLPQQRLQPAMGALLDEMNAPHKNYELHVANALWAQQNQNFLPDYLLVVRDNYGAAFHRTDFRIAPEAARGDINRWVARQTNNKIENLIAPGVLTRATRLVLTNAIYFKGDWRNPFEKSATKDEDFYLSAGHAVKAPMMHRTGGYEYFDGGSFQALELPYAGGDLTMLVLLPREASGLPALEQSFTAASTSKWIDNLKPAAKVILTLPRFSMLHQFELSAVLSKMGMPQAFSDAANFSGMTGRPGFNISAAIHKAYIGVNEQGTEAAAATSTVMRATAMRRQMPQPPIVFRADHPFLFLIRDTRSGSILFMGRVANPTK